MKIWSYILVCPDDADTLPDALDSLRFSDRIYLLDGGNVSLILHPRNTVPIKEWIKARPEYSDAKAGDYPLWNGVPIVVWENTFSSYGQQRNTLLSMLEKEPDRCDWLVWLDSDEVCSDQMINNIRAHLENLPPGTEGVYVKLLNLVQDERHCVGGYHSDWHAHPRIAKVGNHYFSGSVHEHMVIDRSKLARWDVRVIHTRALYRRRLYIQRSHEMVRLKPNPLWYDAVMEDVPPGVTWKPLRWPEGEFPIGIDEDARKYWSIP